jgi:hypothetical protein
MVRNRTNRFCGWLQAIIRPPPPPRAEGTRAAGRAVIDEPRLVEAGDQTGEERGMQWRGHVEHAGAAQA